MNEGTKKRWKLREPKKITAHEAKLAASIRLHQRYTDLEKSIDVLRDKYAVMDEHSFNVQLFELEAELLSVKARIEESN